MACKTYKAFKHCISKCVTKISCPLCALSMLPKHYENHCRVHHNLNPKTGCVFCRNFIWPVNQKVLNGPHLRKCYAEFKKIYKSRCITNFPMSLEQTPSQQPVSSEQVSLLPPETPQPPPLVHEQQKCTKNCGVFHNDSNSSFNKIHDGWDDHPLYDPFLLQDEAEEEIDWLKLPHRVQLMNEAENDRTLLALFNQVRFASHTGLKDAPYWIHRYLYYGRKKYGFYHLCVRAGCIASFVREVESLRESGKKIVLLPYWCACAASKNSKHEDSWKHHRHMIIVSKSKNLYNGCLSKIRYEGVGKIPRNGKKYYSRIIESIGHFISTIVYVSTPRSKCECYRIDKNKKTGWMDKEHVVRQTTGGEMKGHYYIGNPVVPHARLWLTLLAPGKEMDRIAKFLAGSMSVYNMSSKKRNPRTKSWQVSASEVLGVKNCVVLFDPLDWYITNRDLEQDGGSLYDYIKGEINNYFFFDEIRFVYWFDGRVLKMNKLVEEEDFVVERDLKQHVEWCVSKSINVLFNVYNDYFSLGIAQQKHANDLAKNDDEWQNKLNRSNEEWENKLNRLSEEWENKLNRSNEELKQSNEEWQTKLNMLEAEWQNKLKKI